MPLASGQIQVNTTPNPVGSGARALGMGGAFIAVADDATAASWNPGGLTQLERPELSLVYEWVWVEERLRSGLFPETDGEFNLNFDAINYASVVYPIPYTLGGRNIALSLNYQRQYNFDRDLRIQQSNFFAIQGGGIGDGLLRFDYSQRGRLASITPAVAMEITQRLSVGAAINLWDESLIPGNEWKIRTTARQRVRINGRLPIGAFVSTQRDEDYKKFRGTNYTFGVHWRATERLHFGAVYHTELRADVDYIQTARVRTSGLTMARSRIRENRKITFPSAIGVGAAYRFPNDKLTLSLDVTRRDWDSFVIERSTRRINAFTSPFPPGASPFSFGLVDSSQRRVSGVTNRRKELSPHDPTYTVRLGMEYVFVDETKPEQHYLPSIRAGVFYDPEPASNRRDAWWAPFDRFGARRSALGLQMKGDGKPDSYYGVTLGAGLLIRNRVNLDAAYQYRWGDNVRKDSLGWRRTDFDVRQHNLFLSTVVYF